MVEQRIRNAKVAGSNPGGGSKELRMCYKCYYLAIIGLLQLLLRS